MKPKKINNLLTYISVGITIIFLAIYIVLMAVDSIRFNGWLQLLSIVIQLLASFIGVFLAIRMSQWISDKEDKEKVADLWKRISKFLSQLRSDIDAGKRLMELEDYKSYWLSVQNASYESAKVLHNDEMYMDISRIFSFLSYHKNEWVDETYTIEAWINNSSENLSAQIKEWKTKIDNMIGYVSNKANQK